MNDQLVRIRINVRNARMMPLKDESVWRDDSLLMLNWGHAPVRVVLLVDVNISTIPGNVRLVL